MFMPMVLPPCLVRRCGGRFHNALGRCWRRHDEVGRSREGMVPPLREQLRQAGRVFVVAGHLHGGHGALQLQLGRAACWDLASLGRLVLAGCRI